MIYFMDAETLTEEFLHDHSYKEILETNYVIISRRIQYTKDAKVYYSRLYDDKLIFAMYGDDEDKEIIKDGILKSDKKMIEIIEYISRSIINKERFIFLTTKSEMKTKYLKVISQVIEELFEYPIIDYKKDKNKSFSYDPVVVANHIKKYEDDIVKKILSFSDGRKSAVKIMTKKEMKKILKKKGLYSKTMTKSDMKDMLEVFYVEER